MIENERNRCNLRRGGIILRSQFEYVDKEFICRFKLAPIDGFFPPKRKHFNRIS